MINWGVLNLIFILKKLKKIKINILWPYFTNKPIFIANVLVYVGSVRLYNILKIVCRLFNLLPFFNFRSQKNKNNKKKKKTTTKNIFPTIFQIFVYNFSFFLLSLPMLLSICILQTFICRYHGVVVFLFPVLSNLSLNIPLN